MRIELGAKVRDIITGYTGIAIGIHHYLNGCLRITVQSQELKDGKPVDAQSFDVQQLDVLAPAIVSGILRPAAAVDPEALRALAARPGGPQPEPQRRPDPRA